MGMDKMIHKQEEFVYKFIQLIRFWKFINIDDTDINTDRKGEMIKNPMHATV